MRECWIIWSLARNRSRDRAIWERNGCLTFGAYRMCFLLMATFFTVATNSHLERSPTVLFLLLENGGPRVGAPLFRNSYIFLFFFAAERETHSDKFHYARQVPPQKFVLSNIRATCVRIKKRWRYRNAHEPLHLKLSLLCCIATFPSDLYGIWTKLQVRATLLPEMRDDRGVGNEKRYRLRVERHELYHYQPLSISIFFQFIRYFTLPLSGSCVRRARVRHPSRTNYLLSASVWSWTSEYRGTADRRMVRSMNNRIIIDFKSPRELFQQFKKNTNNLQSSHLQMFSYFEKTCGLNVLYITNLAYFGIEGLKRLKLFWGEISRAIS